MPRASKSFTLPVPKNAEFYGPHTDQLAKLSFLLMVYTMSRQERREHGFYINVSANKYHSLFGSDRAAVLRAARDHSNIFEFNERYSTGQGGSDGFTKGIRLAASCRTGETRFYEFRRKPRVVLPTPDSSDPVTEKLRSYLPLFWLPEETPDFANPWQAFTWSSIKNGYYYASRCEFGRFHSNYTAFKHRHWVCSNAPLASIDVRSSQPLIIGHCASRLFPDPSVALWIDICETRDIYTELGRLLLEQDRDAVKLALMEVLFSKLDYMTRHPLFTVILHTFPGIAKYLTARKTRGHYQCVAQECQRVESSIMIDEVAAKLGCPVLTCHDEIILPARHAERAEKLMSRQFGKRKMSPKFKIVEFSA